MHKRSEPDFRPNLHKHKGGSKKFGIFKHCLKLWKLLGLFKANYFSNHKIFLPSEQGGEAKKYLFFAGSIVTFKNFNQLSTFIIQWGLESVPSKIHGFEVCPLNFEKHASRWGGHLYHRVMRRSTLPTWQGRDCRPRGRGGLWAFEMIWMGKGMFSYVQTAQNKRFVMNAINDKYKHHRRFVNVSYKPTKNIRLYARFQIDWLKSNSSIS